MDKKTVKYEVKKGKALIQEIKDEIERFSDLWLFAGKEDETVKLKLVIEALSRIRAVMVIAFFNNFENDEKYLPENIRKKFMKMNEIPNEDMTFPKVEVPPLEEEDDDDDNQLHYS